MRFRYLIMAITILSLGLIARLNVPLKVNAKRVQATLDATSPILQTIFTGKIAFAKKEQDHSQIYTMNTDGSNLRKLSHSSTIDDYAPIWSPDGNKIAFVSFRQDETPNQLNLDVMNADGSNPHSLYKELGQNGAVYDVSWSPNSQQLAFVPKQPKQIYIVDVDNPGTYKVVGFHLDMHNPAWSPDGQHLLFSADVWSSLDEVGLDGSHHITLIPSETDNHVGCISWSPDGQSIAYRYGALGFYGDFVMDATTHTVEAITDATDTQHLEGSCPKWTPDGHYLLFSSNHADYGGGFYGNKFDLYVASVNKPYSLIRLTYDQRFPFDFSWFPNL